MRNWLPLMAGIVVGAAAGLYFSWVAQPVRYLDTAPSSLRRDFQEDYLALIASAYAASGDLLRAQARLALLPDPDPAQSLAALAQRRLAEGSAQSEVLAMASLAESLRPAQPTQAPIASIPTSTPLVTTLPSPTLTRRPTQAATSTPGAPFELASKELVCEMSYVLGVEVLDAAEEPVPGVEVTAIWDAGQDSFFTGLKPEISIGYADFEMQEGVVYALQLSGAAEPVTGLSVPQCTNEEGEPSAGSWLLTFVQP